MYFIMSFDSIYSVSSCREVTEDEEEILESYFTMSGRWLDSLSAGRKINEDDRRAADEYARAGIIRERNISLVRLNQLIELYNLRRKCRLSSYLAERKRAAG